MPFSVPSRLHHAQVARWQGLVSGFFWALSGTLIYRASLLFSEVFVEDHFLYGLLFSALFLAFLHDLSAAFVIFFANFARGKAKEYLRAINLRAGQTVLLGAITGGPIGMSAYTLAIALAGSLYTLPITAVFPLMASLFSRIFLKERLIANTYIGLFLSCLGVGLLSFSPQEDITIVSRNIGLLFAGLAMLGWSLEGVFSTKGMELLDPDIAIGLREIGSSTVFFLLLMLLCSLSEASLSFLWGPTFFEAIATALLAGVAGGFAYFNYYRALNILGVGRAMSLNVTYALWSMPLGWLLSEQTISVSVILGALLVASGTLFSNLHLENALNLRKRKVS